MKNIVVKNGKNNHHPSGSGIIIEDLYIIPYEKKPSRLFQAPPKRRRHFLPRGQPCRSPFSPFSAFTKVLTLDFEWWHVNGVPEGFMDCPEGFMDCPI